MIISCETLSMVFFDDDDDDDNAKLPLVVSVGSVLGAKYSSIYWLAYSIDRRERKRRELLYAIERSIMLPRPTGGFSDSWLWVSFFLFG